jgi:hypothetical protein
VLQAAVAKKLHLPVKSSPSPYLAHVIASDFSEVENTEKASIMI